MFEEIERKFLVNGEYKSLAFKSERVMQGYLNSSPDRTVRVRVKGDRAYLTIKGRNSGAGRFEWEMEIPADQAALLLDLAEPGIIDKTRYLINNTDGSHVWEVDEFHGENDGLVVAEIELSAEDEAFDKPVWIGEEVTGDQRFYNSYLASHPFKNW